MKQLQSEREMTLFWLPVANACFYLFRMMKLGRTMERFPLNLLLRRFLIHIVCFIVQCALLYTTVYGQRRIRVTNLSLPCTNNLSNLFRLADLDSQFVCFLKQGIEFFVRHSLCCLFTLFHNYTVLISWFLTFFISFSSNMFKSLSW
jgi:hypothetical protein